MSSDELKRPDVQGLRGIAVLLVLLFHAGEIVGKGYLGVDLFFVISGFVITKSIFARRHFSVSEFYRKRFWRLTPALIVMLGVVSVISVLVSPLRQLRQTLLSGSAASLGLSNFYFGLRGFDYFSPPIEGNPFLHTWSLGVEFQLYFLLGLVAASASLALPHNYTAQRRNFFIQFAFVSGVLSLCYTVAAPFDEYFAIYFDPLTRLWQFQIGSLAFLVNRSLQTFLKHDQLRSNFLSSAGVLLSFIAVSGYLDATSPILSSVFITVGGALVIVAGQVPGTKVNQLLCARPFFWLGSISYSLYLWHWPAIVLARQVAAAPLDENPSRLVDLVGILLALMVSTASYYLLENRFSGRRENFLAPRRIRSLVLLSVGTLPFVSLVVLEVGSVEERFVEEWHSTTPWPAWRDCNLEPPSYKPNSSLDPFESPKCHFGVVDGSRTILLIGDSTAGALASAVIEAGKATGQKVVVSTGSGCSPVLFSNSECKAYVRRQLDYASQTENGEMTVVISFGAHASFGALEAENALVSIVQAMNFAGNHVFVVEPLLNFDKPPQWEAWGCPIPSLIGGDCPREFKLSEIGTGDSKTREMIARASSRAKFTLIKLDSEQCKEGVCRHFDDGIPMYRDGIHMSEEWSKSLGPFIASKLQPPHSSAELLVSRERR